MEKLIEEKKLQKEGYKVFRRGFIILLEPENLTEQTSGIVQFPQKIDVDKEIGAMIEERTLPKNVRYS